MPRVLEHLIDRAVRARRAGRRASDDRSAAPAARDAATVDAADQTAACVPPVPDIEGDDDGAATTRYPLSWPARDLARTRRLQARAQAAAGDEDGRREDASPEDDPTKVWPRRSVDERDSR